MWLRALGGFAEGKTAGDTIKNLTAAAEGEHEEWVNMYREFAQVAREEGFDALAARFEGVASVEKAHEARYNKLCQNLKDEKAFVREETVTWHCRNCGYIFEGPEAPAACPVCAHPRAYFELEQTNY